MLPPCLGLPVYLCSKSIFAMFHVFIAMSCCDGAFSALICVIDYGLGFDR